jgi:hypothetical protein
VARVNLLRLAFSDYGVVSYDAGLPVAYMGFCVTGRT